jgi:hypothetical protein
MPTGSSAAGQQPLQVQCDLAARAHNAHVPPQAGWGKSRRQAQMWNLRPLRKADSTGSRRPTATVTDSRGGRHFGASVSKGIRAIYKPAAGA